MGVRAENKSISEQFDWVESATQARLDSGKRLISAGKYAEAVEELQEALEAASDEERPEVRYCLASACSPGGDIRNAFKQLSQVTATGGQTWAPDCVLLKAKPLDEEGCRPYIRRMRRFVASRTFVLLLLAALLLFALPAFGASHSGKWVCDVCGYIYDPAVGDPDNHIAPGTSFERLPTDWLCPLCGAEKSDFNPAD